MKYIITINGNDHCLVNKKETYKNLLAVHNGRKWAGCWHGSSKTVNTVFETKEEAEELVAKLNKLNLLAAFYVANHKYEIKAI